MKFTIFFGDGKERKKQPMNLDTKYALATFVVILLLLILTRWTGRDPKPTSTAENTDQLSKLARQAKQFYFLAKQDQNPLMSLVHLCMAVSKLDSLANLATTDQIRLKHDVDVMKLTNDCRELQDELTQEINQLAPKMKLPEHMLL